MKSVFLYLSLFFFSVGIFAQDKRAATNVGGLEDLETLFNQVLKDHHIAGFAVAVVKGDEVIYSKGFGYRDLENKKPVTPNTLFAIGSSTKAFTASLLGLLQKEGKLSLDDKAVRLLPQLNFYNEEMNSQITVRDMIAHRTGLSRYDYSWLLFNTANRDSIISRVKYMQPTAAVRQKWLYNNFMYLAQGMIVEKISGKTWEQNIREKFFEPLDMVRSNTDINTFKNDSDAALPYMTVRDSVIKKIDYYNINGMGPAGSINSSVNDISNWLKVWISGGFYKKKEILPTSYIQEAASSQMVIDSALPRDNQDVFLANYGLGWMIRSYRGHYLVEHGGNINGFSANVAFFPSDQLGIVVLTNQNSSAVPDLVRNSIADKMLKLTAVDWNGKAKERAVKASLAQKEAKANSNKKRILNTSPSHPLKDYVGLFENPGFGVIKVSLEKDELYAVATDSKVLLKHEHYDVFKPMMIDKSGVIDTADSPLRFNFAGNQEGKIEILGIRFEADGKPVEFMARQEVKTLSLGELEKYTGEYTLGKMSVKVYLKGNTLYVFVPGQPEYETSAVGDHTFILKSLKGFSVKFDTEGDKKATSMNFIQPNGTFQASRKK